MKKISSYKLCELTREQLQSLGSVGNFCKSLHEVYSISVAVLIFNSMLFLGWCIYMLLNDMSIESVLLIKGMSIFCIINVLLSMLLRFVLGLAEDDLLDVIEKSEFKDQIKEILEEK